MVDPRAFVVVGLGLGDEGKGSVVDHLVREHDASLVVRFNGGAQAAHRVVTPDGREHVFHQFGSGTLAGAKTYLSEYVFVNPLALATEAADLLDLGVRDPFRLVSVHEDAPITTPFHVALNRLREMSRGDGRHGSCGMGIAETMVDLLAGKHLRFGDLKKPRNWGGKLQSLAYEKYQIARALPVVDSDAWREEMRVLRRGADAELVETFSIVANHVDVVGDLPDADVAIFEGAQGILLDQDWGFPPYHTWAKTTSENALQILNGRGETTVLGVVRAYATRHGRGPFPTESSQTIAKPDAANGTNAWQENFRIGWPDLSLVRFAAEVDGRLDGLVVTCLDKLLRDDVLVAERYENLADVPAFGAGRTELMERAIPHYREVSVEDLPYLLDEAAGVPLYAVSRGETANDKQVVVCA